MAKDWQDGSNRPRPTAAAFEGETPLEYLYRLYLEGMLTYDNGKVYKHYDFRGKGSWLRKPIEVGNEDPNGYVSYTYRFDGKYRRIGIHRLVYLFFHGPLSLIDPGKAVNHVDGNKKNNRIENLELLSHSANVTHALSIGLRKVENTNTAKLSWEKVREIREIYAKGNVTQREIGERFGVNQTTVSSIVLNRTWREYDGKDFD